MAYPTAEARQLRSWLDAGLAAHRRGNIDQALAAYRQILVVAPEYGPALNLLGTGLLQLGHAGEAVPYLERAVRRQCDDAGLLGNLAQAYLALGRYAEAGDVFRKASRIAPGTAQFQVGVAAALALQGKLADAATLLEKLSTRFPDEPLVWLNLGNVLHDTHRFEPALEAYRKALELDPGMVEARNSIGSVLHSLLRFSEAEKEYRACIEAAPDDLIPRYNLASVTMDLGRFSEAEAVSRDIVARAPHRSDAHGLVGTALGQQARLLEALPWHRQAAALAPEDPRTAQTYGAALMEVGRAGEGLRWLSHAAALDPRSAGVKRVTSGALLAYGCLQDAWIPYAYRPGAPELRETHRASQSLPHTLAGLQVCVLAEQGLGDQLFFLRWSALLASRGARVIHRASRKLYGLLQRAHALDTVLPENAQLPHADAYVLAGDLPRALGELPASALPGAGASVAAYAALPEFRRSIAIFWPQPAPTLRIEPLPERVAQWRERLAALGPAPYTGVTWRGGTVPEKQRTGSWLLCKTIGLSELARALDAVPGTFMALQREPVPGEIETLATGLGRPVHDLTALNDDLEGMLAVLVLLDEYVGVSNTNVHLRAAAGRDTRVLVPAPAEWRWLQSGGSSPWFPGCTIYRQSLQGDWSAALERLQRDLEARIGRR